MAGSVAPITDFGGQLTIRIRMPLRYQMMALPTISPISGIRRKRSWAIYR